MISTFLQRLKQSDLLRNSSTLILGTVFAQLIPILFQPLLRRMFSAEAFGTAALYITAVGMLVAIANLKYESAVVLPEKDQEARSIVSGAVWISAVFSIVCFAFIFFNKGRIGSYFELNATESWYLHFLPISVFFVSSFQCFNYYLIRKKAYKASARNKVYRRGAEALVQSSTGLGKYSSGLLLGNLMGDVVNFFGGYRQAKHEGFRFSWNFTEIKQSLQSHWQFPVFHALPSFLNTISLTLPVFIVNAVFGKAETGQFDLSRMVLSLPMALISIALSQVYLQHQAEKIRAKASIISDLKKVSFGLLALSLPLATILYFFAGPLFQFAFGQQWELAGQLTAILVFGQSLKFVVSPLSSTLVALKEVRFSAFWQILYFGAMLYLYLHPGKDMFEFVGRYCVIDLIAYAVYYGLIYAVVWQYENKRG
ncbi:MAG: hypothetical protein RLZZ301_1216 [Bacteroidota bacterium]|jgi:O-antigen/teichoic acid export membrane protein